MKKITIIAIILIAMLLASCSPQNETPVIVEEEISTTPTETKPKPYELNYYGAPFSQYDPVTEELQGVTELNSGWLADEWDGDSDFESLAATSSDGKLLYVLSSNERKPDGTHWRLYVYYCIEDTRYSYFDPWDDEVNQDEFMYYRDWPYVYNTTSPIAAYKFSTSKDHRTAYSFKTEDGRVIVSYSYYIDNAVELDVSTLGKINVEEKGDCEALNGVFYMVFDPVERELLFPEEVFVYNIDQDEILNPRYLSYVNWNKDGLDENEGWLSNTRRSSLVGYFNNDSKNLCQISTRPVDSRDSWTEDWDYWKISFATSYICSDYQF